MSTQWRGFMVITKEDASYPATYRPCALQAFEAGLEQGIYKDSKDAAKKGLSIGYVQVELVKK
jgi:hypothetical protein